MLARPKASNDVEESGDTVTQYIEAPPYGFVHMRNVIHGIFVKIYYLKKLKSKFHNVRMFVAVAHVSFNHSI